MLKAKLTTTLLKDCTDRLTLRFLNIQLLLVIDSWTIYLFICGPFKQPVCSTKCKYIVYLMMISE